MNQLPLYEQWSQQLRTTPKLESYHIPGTGTSFPVLASEGGTLQIRYFFHIADIVAADEMLIRSPSAIAHIQMDNFTVVKLVEKDAFDLPAFDEARVVLTADERKTRKAALKTLKTSYDDIVLLYPHTPAGRVGQTFLDALLRIAPKPLHPYYEALSPHFWNWLQE